MKRLAKGIFCLALALSLGVVAPCVPEKNCAAETVSSYGATNRYTTLYNRPNGQSIGTIENGQALWVYSYNQGFYRVKVNTGRSAGLVGYVNYRHVDIP